MSSPSETHHHHESNTSSTISSTPPSPITRSPRATSATTIRQNTLLLHNPPQTFHKSHFSIKEARETEQKLKNELQQLDQELHDMSDQDLFNTMIESIQQYKVSVQHHQDTSSRQPAAGSSSQSHHHHTDHHQEEDASDLQQYVDIIEILREKLELTMQELAYERDKVDKLVQSRQKEIALARKDERAKCAAENKSRTNQNKNSSPSKDHTSQTSPTRSMQSNPRRTNGKDTIIHEMRDEMDDLRAENETLNVTVNLLQNHNEMLKQQFLNEKRNSKLAAQHCKKLESLIAFQKEEVDKFILTYKTSPVSSPRVEPPQKTVRHHSSGHHQHTPDTDNKRRRRSSGHSPINHLSPIPHGNQDDSHASRGIHRLSNKISPGSSSRATNRKSYLKHHHGEHTPRSSSSRRRTNEQEDGYHSPRRSSGMSPRQRLQSVASRGELRRQSVTASAGR
eukprot:CAMPEP_0117451192 /NCGR_PEP_ID=MMETSP0759-20121206/8878_1 /TAXON_ID=63605 /ORGANISM="Percolomonas cosmopolitus, Strain WS" /LENGTH=450 /DNA_ID=CAMNT_0005243779 /DNA_START=175 /DNA_END=1527 /DNA_ORIENTATION=-